MKVSGLTYMKLAYWVAKAQGWTIEQGRNHYGDSLPFRNWFDSDGDHIYLEDKYLPHRNKAQAFELIEKFGIEVKPIQSRMDGSWYAHCKYYDNYRNNSQVGSTPQEAICRAVVASVYGAEVKDV